MSITPAAAVRTFDNVATMLDDHTLESGTLVRVTGEYVQEAGKLGQLTDNTNVISGAGTSSVVDPDWAATLSDTPAIRALFEGLDGPPSGFIGSTDVRRATVELTGTVTSEPRMMLSPPSRYMTIDATEAVVKPAPDPDDFGGFIG